MVGGSLTVSVGYHFSASFVHRLWLKLLSGSKVSAQYLHAGNTKTRTSRSTNKARTQSTHAQKGCNALFLGGAITLKPLGVRGCNCLQGHFTCKSIFKEKNKQNKTKSKFSIWDGHLRNVWKVALAWIDPTTHCRCLSRVHLLLALPRFLFPLGAAGGIV